MEHAYGLAVDIGTTTVAGYLCDLRSGEVMATESMMNPQVTFGEDVMSRITYAMAHPGEGLEQDAPHDHRWVEPADRKDRRDRSSFSQTTFWS